MNTLCLIVKRFCAGIALVFLVACPALSHARQSSTGEGSAYQRTVMLFFWGEGCSHCAAAKPFLEELARCYPSLEIRSYEVFGNKKNQKLLEDTAKARGVDVRGVPVFVIGTTVIEGFGVNSARDIETVVRRTIEHGSTGQNKPRLPGSTPITIPIIGPRDASSLSLPAFTLVVALLDSVNPCAFFVLITLLSLLVHARSRKRMLLVGGVFIVCSGVFYFLFMAVWLNLFFLLGHLSMVTIAAGSVALIISLVNIKDFFFFKKGISLSIPDGAKPKLYERMRALLRTDSLPSILTGSIVLAAAANSYELLCTAGFPMVYTRVLTLNALSTTQHYSYLVLYNLIYILPLSLIVALFMFTMGSRKLSEHQGRVLKLVSGLMMLALAIVLLFEPSLLNSAGTSAIILLAVSVGAGLIVWMENKVRNP